MDIAALTEAGTHLRFDQLHLDPVLWHIHAFGRDLFDIKWYSIAYIAGILVGWWYLLKLIAQPGAPMARRHADDLVFYATIGIIIGGRLGYVIFYAPEMFLNPISLLQLWEGGMSFHGGVVGTTIGILFMARQHKLSWLRIHDYVACCAPFGLFFGRLANFVNGELWGKPSNVPWAIVFPHTPADVARHPSQLYEAGLEGVVLFAVLWFFFWKTRARYAPGKLVGIFLVGYGLSRVFLEFFREPDAQFAGTFFASVHMGQLLSIPMILGGAWLIATSTRRTPEAVPA